MLKRTLLSILQPVSDVPHSINTLFFEYRSIEGLTFKIIDSSYLF